MVDGYSSCPLTQVGIVTTAFADYDVPVIARSACIDQVQVQECDKNPTANQQWPPLGVVPEKGVLIGEIFEFANDAQCVTLNECSLNNLDETCRECEGDTSNCECSWRCGKWSNDALPAVDECSDIVNLPFDDYACDEAGCTGSGG